MKNKKLSEERIHYLYTQVNKNNSRLYSKTWELPYPQQNYNNPDLNYQSIVDTIGFNKKYFDNLKLKIDKIIKEVENKGIQYYTIASDCSSEQCWLKINGYKPLSEKQLLKLDEQDKINNSPYSKKSELLREKTKNEMLEKVNFHRKEADRLLNELNKMYAEILITLK